eukprot:COSAG01_NODE_1007_length_12161_cov_12.669624_5_plen_85_part_00
MAVVAVTWGQVRHDGARGAPLAEHQRVGAAAESQDRGGGGAQGRLLRGDDRQVLPASQNYPDRNSELPEICLHFGGPVHFYIML